MNIIKNFTKTKHMGKKDSQNAKKKKKKKKAKEKFKKSLKDMFREC